MMMMMMMVLLIVLLLLLIVIWILLMFVVIVIVKEQLLLAILGAEKGRCCFAVQQRQIGLQHGRPEQFQIAELVRALVRAETDGMMVVIVNVVCIKIV